MSATGAPEPPPTPPTGSTPGQSASAKKRAKKKIKQINLKRKNKAHLMLLSNSESLDELKLFFNLF